LDGKQSELNPYLGADMSEDRTEELLEVLKASDSESIRELALIDQRTGASVSHRDVGIGISQVLPVLVMAYGSQGKILAMEQPEIHLHPALQAELGDVFIESALGKRNNTFILETHSEHLILRIMRRLRESYDGTLPVDIPKLRAEDVQILYVEPLNEGSVVREMPLNDQGELVKAWPGGFFEEGLREVMP
jgi:predicted ATPase